MAWITDPNFGSLLTSSKAVAPFNITNNNQMLGMGGAGALYRDDLNTADMQLSCDMFFDSRGQAEHVAGLLISRRQSDGSFYAATWALLGLNFSSSINFRINIIEYNGITDIATQLDTFAITAFDPDIIRIGDLLHLNFITQGNNLVFTVKNDLNITRAEIDIIDNTITAAGNPGIGAQLFNFDTASNKKKSVNYIDNLSIKEI